MQSPETDSYCHYVSKLKTNDPHRIYHDNFYGKEVHDDNELFGKLILEINQAGLSWTTILHKQDNLRKAYSNFNIKKVSMYSNDDIEILLTNAGIIRNRLKINAIIYNANKIIQIQKDFGSFYLWLKKLKGKDIEDWIKIFKSNFKFTGPEITREFLISTAFIEGAHVKSCPFYKY
tara:strand:+ start:1063 stop:1590 length:528 start_codon:yes stop_codon:yes gene_type:complete